MDGVLVAISEYGFTKQKEEHLELPAICEGATLVLEMLRQMSGEQTDVDVFSAFLRYETSRHGKRVPCCQTPRNQYYIAEILQCFPAARFVYLIRDPRSVLLSQKRKWRVSLRIHGRKEMLRTYFNYHPLTISLLWRSSIKNYFRNQTKVCTVLYEQMVSAPEQAIGDVCTAMGIDFQPEMLEVDYTGSSLDSDVYKNAKGISTKSLGAWRRGGLNSAEIFICQLINKKLMQKVGYQCVRIFPNPFLIIFYLFTFPAKVCVAFLANLGRMKSIRATIAKRLNFK